MSPQVIQLVAIYTSGFISGGWVMLAFLGMMGKLKP